MFHSVDSCLARHPLLSLQSPGDWISLRKITFVISPRPQRHQVWTRTNFLEYVSLSARTCIGNLYTHTWLEREGFSNTLPLLLLSFSLSLFCLFIFSFLYDFHLALTEVFEKNWAKRLLILLHMCTIVVAAFVFVHLRGHGSRIGRVPCIVTIGYLTGAGCWIT